MSLKHHVKRSFSVLGFLSLLPRAPDSLHICLHFQGNWASRMLQISEAAIRANTAFTEHNLMSPNTAKWPWKFFGFLPLFFWVAVSFWRSNRILTYDSWKASVPNPQNDPAEQNAACLYNLLTFLRVPPAMRTHYCSLRAIGRLSQAGGFLSLCRKPRDTRGLQQGAVKVCVTRAHSSSLTTWTAPALLSFILTGLHHFEIW